MDNYTELLVRKNKIDCEYQHLKYYHEGYRHCTLINLYGEQGAYDSFGIDDHPYSPDGARDVSYRQGWDKATKDFELVSE